MTKHLMNDSSETTSNSADRPKLEKALRHAAQEWKTTFDAISDAVCLIDRDGKIIRANKAMTRFLGKPFQSILGQYCYELIHGSSERIEKCPIFRMQKSRQRESMLIQKGDRWLNVAVDPIMDDTGEIISAVHIISDITEVKKITDDLRLSEEKFRMIAENSVDDIFQLDFEGNITYVSPAQESMFRYSKDEALNMNFMDFICESDIPIAQETFNAVIEKNESRLVELNAQRKDKSVVPLEIIVYPFLKDNIPIGVQGIARDITERKKAREELEKRNTFIETIIDNLPIGLGVNKISDNKVLYINPKFEEIYGWPKKALPDVDAFFRKAYPDPEYRKKIQDRILSDMVSGDPEKMQWADIMATGMDGKQRIIFAKNIPLYDQDVMISTVQDMTETKRLESQLRQAHKMESIGTLAGGIAHDFNNILSIIMGNTELAIEDIPEWSPLHEYLDESRKACLRAKDLIRQLLGFSRQSDEKQQPMDICPVVKESLILLRSIIPTNISFKQHISPECHMIMADPTQIHQIMINVFTNSAHAMEESGGEIAVLIDNAHIDEGRAALINALKPGHYVKFSVKDTGCGIEPTDMDRIFDPYFTTKEFGKGTGMGLALVHGIVKSHGGSILMDSRLGEGTTINIFFPSIPRKTIEPTEQSEAPLPGGNERILFIDDEAPMVRLGQRWLERLGYDVEVESDSVEALALIREEPYGFDLVITDMAMPNMTGDKLSEHILDIRSDIPIILCTGFSDRIDEEKAKNMGIREFLIKPVSIKQLAETVRAALNKLDTRASKGPT